MKIIINPTDNHIDAAKMGASKEDTIISPFKIDSANFNHIFLPPTGSDAGNLNHAFWIINSLRHVKVKDFEKIEILGINFRFHNLNREKIIQKTKKDVNITEFKHQKQEAKIIIEKGAAEKAVKYPFLIDYFERDSDHFKDYFEFWFLCLRKNGISVNYELPCKECHPDICRLFYEKIKSSDKKYPLFKEKCSQMSSSDGTLVNLGNEGKIVRKGDNKIIKIVRAWNKHTKWINEFDHDVIYDGPLKLYKNDLNIVDEYKDANNNKIILDKKTFRKDVKWVNYTYDNTLLPTNDFSFPHLARFVKSQIENDVYVIDIKKENFAKMPLEHGFFKLVYSDFGKAFVKIKNEKEKFQLGLCRDLFILREDYKSWKYRETIRASRIAADEEKIKKVLNTKILELYKFVKKEYDNDLWPCHNDDDWKKCESKNWKTPFKVCNGSSSMRFLWGKRENKSHVYDLKTHKTYECDFANQKKKIEREAKIKLTKLVGLNQNLDEGIIGYEHDDNRPSCN